MEWLTLILNFLLGALGIHYLFQRKFRDPLGKLGILRIQRLPVLGNMAPVMLKRRPLCQVIDEVYKLNDEAKYVGFYNFNESVIIIRAPELIKDILVKNFDHFVDHRGFTDTQHDPLFGENVFSLRGDEWKNMRALLSPAFTSSKMKTLFKLMSECGENFANQLARDSATVPKMINMKDTFERYTIDVIAACEFGVVVDATRNPKNEFFATVKSSLSFEGSLSLKFLLVHSFPTMAKLFGVKMLDLQGEDFFLGVVRDTVEARLRENVTRPDMIQQMMESREKEFTVRDITIQALVFFFGGFDTTSALMGFVVHELASNQDVQRKLQKEVDDVLDRTNGELSYEAVNAMEFLDAVISETLRLYPVVAFFDRICVKRFELPAALPGGKPITVEPGQILWFPSYSVHRDRRHFPDPEQFDPERFVGHRKNEISPYTYLPFGQGPRMCIGNKFALLKTKVVLFYLLAKFSVTTCEKTQLPIELHKSSFTLTAEGGFWVKLEPRPVS